MFNVGVIGIGSMGKNHARVYTELENINLVGVADLDVKSAKQIAKRFNTNWYKDYQELIKKVDALTISTPTITHYIIAQDAINQGKHILVEKPISHNIEETQKLIDSAKKQGVILSVGHIERHNPVVLHTKNLIKNNNVGKPVTLTSRRVSSYPARIRDVGVIHDLGIHDIDIMRYLANDEVKSVYALAGKAIKTEYEEHANILIKFKNGVSGFIEVNWLTPLKVRKLSLTCTTHFVELDYMAQTLKISSSEFLEIDDANLFQLPLEYHIRDISLKKQEPLKNELTDFLEAIEKKREPLVTGEDGLKALEIAQAALESYKTNKKIDLY